MSILKGLYYRKVLWGTGLFFVFVFSISVQLYVCWINMFCRRLVTRMVSCEHEKMCGCSALVNLSTISCLLTTTVYKSVTVYMNCIGSELQDLKQYGYVSRLTGLPFETDNLWYYWNITRSLIVSLYYMLSRTHGWTSDQAKLLLNVYHQRSSEYKKV